MIKELNNIYACNEIRGKIKYLTDDHAYSFLRDTRIKRALSIDIETYRKKKYINDADAGLLPLKSNIRLLQIYDGEDLYILDFMCSSEVNLVTYKEFVDLLYGFLHAHTLIAHNALFETSHFQHIFRAYYGSYEPLCIQCTQMMYRLAISAQTCETAKYKASLDVVAKTLLNKEYLEDEQMSDWSCPLLTDSQLDYAARDVIYTRDVFKKLVPFLEDYDLTTVYELNVKAQEALAMMRIYGICIDKKRHKISWDKWDSIRNKAYQDCLMLLNNHIYDLDKTLLTTIALAKVTKKMLDVCKNLITTHEQYENLNTPNTVQMFEEFFMDLHEKSEDKSEKRAFKRVSKNFSQLLINIDSGKQISSWLVQNLPQDVIESWPRTKKGQLKTDDEAFSEQPDLTELIPLRTYKKHANYVGTYCEGLSKFFVEKGQSTFVYPNYTLCKTDTGRMSSFEPNLQNQPRLDEVRNWWVASAPDRKLLCADFSQIELRVAAYLSKDPVMIQAFEDGVDLHAITAANMTGKKINEITKEDRQAAKGVNFGLLFGAGATTLKKYVKRSYGVDMTIEAAEEAKMIWYDLYHVYVEWMQKQAKRAEKTLRTRTPLGKLRILHPEYTYSTSMNTPVQGGASEIMLAAAWYITESLLKTKLDGHLVNIVHDESITETHDDCIIDVAKIIKKSKEKALLTVFPEATILNLVEVGCGTSWLEAKGKNGIIQLK